MIKTTLKIEGLACSMCEAHINDVVRKTAAVKKVTSSHKKGETIILSEQPLDIPALKEAIGATGYKVADDFSEQVEKPRRFLFGR